MIRMIKERKSLVKVLVVILLIMFACYLPQEILFWTLCTEQDRELPPNTELLVSACKKPGARGVPGGEVLFVHEVETGKLYLLDLRTGEKRKVPEDPLLLDKGVFLSSELVWLMGSPGGPGSASYRPHYVLNLTDGNRYELLDLTWLPLKDGRFDPQYYEYIKSAHQVFLHHGENRVIALSSDLSRGKNVIFYKSGAGKRGELLEQLLKDLNVNYEIIDFSLYDTGVPSPTNKYVVRFNGIYLTATNQRVSLDAGMFNYFKGWYYDESGVIVKDAGACKIPFIGANCLYYVPGPVFKINISEP